ncbi:MAG TPA: hypothetical protein VEH07_02915 [Alphaproteobacteria bacterium]|nr:hypothetical protein [Alphaproteobacteria bacterium]
MKIRRLLLLAAAAAGMSFATVSADAAASSKFLGAWTLDLSKAPPPAAGAPPAPKSVTLVTSDAGGGKWKSAVDVVGADGKTTHQESTYTLDGKPNAVTGDANVDSIEVTCPDANTMVVAESKAGKPVSKVTVKLSADGKQQTATIEGTGPDGKPMTRTETWNRK